MLPSLRPGLSSSLSPSMWHEFDNQRTGSSGSSRKARCCLGFLLASAFLAGMACHATSKETSPSCSDASAAVPQQVQQAASTQDSDAAHPGHSRPRSIKLTWDPGSSPKGAVAGYRIFRRESDSTCDRAAGACEFKPLNPHTPIKGTTCTDYDVQPGRTYLYEVETVGTNHKVSTRSNQAKASLRR